MKQTSSIKKRKIAAFRSRRFVVIASWSAFLLLIGIMNFAGVSSFSKTASNESASSVGPIKTSTVSNNIEDDDHDDEEHDDDEEHEEHEEGNASSMTKNETSTTTSTTYAAKPTYTSRAPVTQTRSNGS